MSETPTHPRLDMFHSRYGGHGGGETPGPIPNPEAKPSSADGTAPARMWESRTPPDYIPAGPRNRGPVCVVPLRPAKIVNPVGGSGVGPRAAQPRRQRRLGQPTTRRWHE